MLKSLRTQLLTVAVLALCGSSAQATFNVLVQGTSGPAFLTYNSPATSNFIDLFDNAPFSGQDLILSYSVTNTAPTSGSFQLNNLSFIYQGNSNPISLQVLITEDAANFFGAGAPLNGFASYTASGNVNSSFSNTTSLTPGIGMNTVSFPMQNFPGSPTVFNGATGFVSGGTVGTISTLFNITITPNSNVSFSGGGGFGNIGVSTGVVPVPATALLGLFAVPTLAMLRRRFAK